MTDFQTITFTSDDNGVATLTLNRPDARNAMSQEMIEELTVVADQIAADDRIRAVVLTGAGEIFCAGGDLKGMMTQAGRTRAERIVDARAFAKTLAALDRLPKPVIGRINGSAFGGGLGLISICDVAIAVSSAKFAFTEVSLGLMPATISPYCVARIGEPAARQMILNARRITAAEAVERGLVMKAVEADELDAAVREEVSLVLQCAPGAVAAAKELIRFVSRHDTEDNIGYTADRLADAWESAEIKEGIDAFLNKRKPAWRVELE